MKSNDDFKISCEGEAAVLDCAFGIPHTAAYLAHVEDGCSMQEIARARGQHASTVMRQIHKVENKRDDPLIDLALKRARQLHQNGNGQMKAMAGATGQKAGNEKQKKALDREARRVLRRLCEGF